MSTLTMRSILVFPDQYDIALNDVVNDTPPIEKTEVVFIYEPAPVVETVTSDSFTLRSIAVFPDQTDVLLYEDISEFVRSVQCDVILRSVLGEEEEAGPPPITYYGILKRYNGMSWVKAKLQVFNGSWVDAILKFWDGSDWKIIDTTGVI